VAVYDIAAIRNGLATAIQTAVPDGQVSPYILSNPTPPYAYVLEGDIAYDLAMNRGWDELEFIVLLCVGFTTDQGAQQRLDGYRQPGGLKAALEADRTLGGVCDDLIVTRASKPQLYGQNGVLGCEFTVHVWATAG
jgi:hypothetical protein